MELAIGIGTILLLSVGFYFGPRIRKRISARRGLWYRNPADWSAIWTIFLVVLMPWASIPFGMVALLIFTLYYQLPASLFGYKHFVRGEWNMVGPGDTAGIVLSAAFYLGVSIVLGLVCAGLGKGISAITSRSDGTR